MRDVGALVRVEEFVRQYRMEPGADDTLERAGDDDWPEYLTVPDLLEVLHYARATAVLQAIAMTHDHGRGGCACDLCATLRDRAFTTRVDTM